VYIDRLPHAIGAGYSAGNHKPCLQGTRIAVLQDIEAWEVNDPKCPIYWLKGVAGCGKSTIAQTFAEGCAAHGRLGTSFFCSRDFPDRRNLRLIFPTMARDLAYQHPDFRAALVEILRSGHDVEHDSLDVQFEKLIVQPLKLTGLSMTIVVDALDECKDNEPVSAFLSVLAKYVGGLPNVKFFITGRPEDHIRSGFAILSLRTKELPLHDVESSTVESDIRSFVKAGLEGIAMRNQFCVSGSWPTDKDVTAITSKAAGHFIVASIIIGFVDYPHAMPQDRLKLILRILDSTIYEGRTGIDVTYDQVLVANLSNVDKDDSEFFEQLRLVMASIVLAFHPLSRASLASILGMSSERIWTILRSLHSVIIVPDSASQPIRICHKSFADFLADPRRCSDTRLHINAPVHHSQLGASCLELMKKKLTKNICQLPRYSMNKDIKDLDSRRERYIGFPLAYACEYWAKHLEMSIGPKCDTDIVVKLVDELFRCHFLSWLEVLSIEANLGAAIQSLRDVRSWLKDVDVPLVKGSFLDWAMRYLNVTIFISFQMFCC
jgi:NACHT domain